MVGLARRPTKKEITIASKLLVARKMERKRDAAGFMVGDPEQQRVHHAALDSPLVI